MVKLKKKEAVLFKQRWQRIEAMQTQELQTAPLSLKFKQLCWLMNSFVVRDDEKREKAVHVVRRRWMRLKQYWKKYGQ